MLKPRQKTRMNLGLLVAYFRSARGLSQKIITTPVGSMIHEVIVKTRRYANHRENLCLCGLLVCIGHV